VTVALGHYPEQTDIMRPRIQQPGLNQPTRHRSLRSANAFGILKYTMVFGSLRFGSSVNLSEIQGGVTVDFKKNENLAHRCGSWGSPPQEFQTHAMQPKTIII
jgi:hypothetical protein